MSRLIVVSLAPPHCWRALQRLIDQSAAAASRLAHRRFLGVATLLFGMLPAMAAADEGAVATQTLRYEITYQGIDAGEVVIDIRADADGYVVTSTSKPSMLARMFVQDHASVTHFARRRDAAGEQVALAHGVERSATRARALHERRFELDRARGVIEFRDGDDAPRQEAIAADDRFEAAAFPLLLMLHPRAQLEQLDGARVREVSARRVRDYQYEAPAPETIEVPAGRFDSWRIRRHRADRPADRITVWLRNADGDDADAVPLKIRIDKRGKRSVLVLAERRVGDGAAAAQ